MNRRYCPRCGNKVVRNGCGHCGFRFDEAPGGRVPGEGVPKPEMWMADQMVGRTMAGQFRIVRVIGRGGMGTVFLAEQISVGRQVALKVINPELAGGKAAARLAMQRFRREALAASRLHHPNTVQLYDFGVTRDGQAWLAMDYLPGHTMADLMRDGPQPACRVIGIAMQVCWSLDEAHRFGIVHRDLKPDNIMLTRTAADKELVKVLDFGIARMTATDDMTTITATGLVVGTPAYMAPEQARGAKVGPATDLYSLGIIMYQALVGVLPFTAATPVELMRQQVQDIPPPLPRLGTPDGVPPALAGLVMRLLAKDPRRRPASALDVARQLEQIAGGECPDGVDADYECQDFQTLTPTMADELQADLDTQIDSLAPAGSTTRRWLYVIAAAAALVVLGGLVWILTH
ncbi:MAG TPA: serine/threonine-protein kinase [Myxococcota bacterium]|nr:serine/threonine-protein kinase [Myxococcota bacterium]